jgi:hypothetical protein
VRFVKIKRLYYLLICKYIFTILSFVVVHEDLEGAGHFSLYTVVVEEKGGVFDNAGIDFTDFDFTFAIYPSDARVAPTVFVSSYYCVFVDQVQVKSAGVRRHPEEFLVRAAEYLNVSVNLFYPLHGGEHSSDSRCYLDCHYALILDVGLTDVDTPAVGISSSHNGIFGYFSGVLSPIVVFKRIRYLTGEQNKNCNTNRSRPGLAILTGLSQSSHS